jgi:hypothetical protein
MCRSKAVARVPLAPGYADTSTSGIGGRLEGAWAGEEPVSRQAFPGRIHVAGHIGSKRFEDNGANSPAASSWAAAWDAANTGSAASAVFAAVVPAAGATKVGLCLGTSWGKLVSLHAFGGCAALRFFPLTSHPTKSTSRLPSQVLAGKLNTVGLQARTRKNCRGRAQAES